MTPHIAAAPKYHIASKHAAAHHGALNRNFFPLHLLLMPSF